MIFDIFDKVISSILFVRNIESGKLVLSHSNKPQQVLVKTKNSVDRVWCRLDSGSNPVCGGGNLDYVSEAIIVPNGFIINVIVNSNSCKVYWLALEND